MSLQLADRFPFYPNHVFQKSPRIAAPIKTNAELTIRIIMKVFESFFGWVGVVVVVVTCCACVVGLDKVFSGIVAATGFDICCVAAGTFRAAASTSACLYPALMKLCFAFIIVSPRSSAFFNPPINSCSRFGVSGATMLIPLHRALSGIVFRVCIPFLLQDLPSALFYLVLRELGLRVVDLLFA